MLLHTSLVSQILFLSIVMAPKKKGTAAVPAVKQEAAPRQSNFSPNEDVALSKAYVSCTGNPLCGVEQKGSQFWNEVAEKFFLLVSQSDLLEPAVKRTAASVKNRWNKHIQPDMNRFLPYLKKVKAAKPSGFTVDQHVVLAADDYRYSEGSLFRFIPCVETLLELPKFSAMLDTGSDEDDLAATFDQTADAVVTFPTVNSTADPMGSTMERPIGNKRAKKEQFNGKIALADNKALNKMAASHDAIAASFELKHKKESLKMQFDMHAAMDDKVGMRAILSKLQNLNDQEYGSNQPPMPTPPASLTASSVPPSPAAALSANGVENTSVGTRKSDDVNKVAKNLAV